MARRTKYERDVKKHQKHAKRKRNYEKRVYKSNRRRAGAIVWGIWGVAVIAIIIFFGKIIAGILAIIASIGLWLYGKTGNEDFLTDKQQGVIDRQEKMDYKLKNRAYHGAKRRRWSMITKYTYSSPKALYNAYRKRLHRIITGAPAHPVQPDNYSDDVI